MKAKTEKVCARFRDSRREKLFSLVFFGKGMYALEKEIPETGESDLAPKLGSGGTRGNILRIEISREVAVSGKSFWEGRPKFSPPLQHGAG